MQAVRQHTFALGRMYHCKHPCLSCILASCSALAQLLDIVTMTGFAPAPADFYMSLYNVVFTALTPLIVGTMDCDVNREMSRKYPGLPPHFSTRAVIHTIVSKLLCTVDNDDVGTLSMH